MFDNLKGAAMTLDDALAAAHETLAVHDAGSIYLFTMPGAAAPQLVVELCSDDDGEDSFLELPAADWAGAYEALRGDADMVVVNTAGAVRTW